MPETSAHNRSTNLTHPVNISKLVFVEREGVQKVYRVRCMHTMPTVSWGSQGITQKVLEMQTLQRNKWKTHGNVSFEIKGKGGDIPTHTYHTNTVKCTRSPQGGGG